METIIRHAEEEGTGKENEERERRRGRVRDVHLMSTWMIIASALLLTNYVNG